MPGEGEVVDLAYPPHVTESADHQRHTRPPDVMALHGCIARLDSSCEASSAFQVNDVQHPGYRHPI
jgi:hypothetical protein